MAEFDIGELIDLCSESEFFDFAGDTKIPTDEMEGYFKDFKERLPEDFSGRFEEVHVEDGRWKMRVDGKDIDIKSLKEKLSAKIEGGELKPPDYKGFVEEILPEGKFDTKALDEYTKTQNIRFEKQVENINKLSKYKKGGQRFAKKYGIPKNEAEFEETLKKNGKWEKTSKAWDALNKAGEKVGTFLKYGLVLGAAASLYEAIKQHQDKMNGCWYIKTTDPDNTKCKISQMTCAPADTQSSDFSKCSTCPNVKKCKELEFNLAFSDATPINDNRPFPHANCSNVEKVSGKPNCATSSDCAIGENKNCQDGNCRPERFNLPANYTVQCVNVDFWTAAQDLTKGALGLDGFGDIFADILKIGGLVFGGIVLLLVLSVVIQIVRVSWNKSDS